ncbi:DUF397 domain-containing protein [Spirillospora sp. CA-142024]|uniref:DUF397 domain-containing protein n=1 Tax=Spirillospora sp. CA-142024 TaxID=3240036 RepID=UPI003D93DAE4
MTGSELPYVIWRKSTYSGSQADDCVELASIWRKSSHSGSQAGECVEVTPTGRAVAVRDSKDPDGPVLAFEPQAWSAFLTTLKRQDG